MAYILSVLRLVSLRVTSLNSMTFPFANDRAPLVVGVRAYGFSAIQQFDVFRIAFNCVLASCAFPWNNDALEFTSCAGCRQCDVHMDDLSNMHLDVDGKERKSMEIVRRRLEAVKKCASKTDATSAASLYGVATDDNPLSQLHPLLDLISQTPVDPLHSELLGITKVLITSVLQ